MKKAKEVDGLARYNHASGDMVPNYPLTNKDMDRDVFYIKWIIGGRTGGSCWGGELHSMHGEAEPNFTELDEYLEENHPSLTFLQYKRLANLIQEAETTEKEYYGNCTNYKIKYIFVDEVDAFIRELRGLKELKGE